MGPLSSTGKVAGEARQEFRPFQTTDHSQRPSVPTVTPPVDLPMDISYSPLHCPEITPNSRAMGTGYLLTHSSGLTLRCFPHSEIDTRGAETQGQSKLVAGVLPGCRKHLGPQMPLETAGSADNSQQ